MKTTTLDLNRYAMTYESFSPMIRHQNHYHTSLLNLYKSKKSILNETPSEKNDRGNLKAKTSTSSLSTQKNLILVDSSTSNVLEEQAINESASIKKGSRLKGNHLRADPTPMRFRVAKSQQSCRSMHNHPKSILHNEYQFENISRKKRIHSELDNNTLNDVLRLTTDETSIQETVMTQTDENYFRPLYTSKSIKSLKDKQNETDEDAINLKIHQNNQNIIREKIYSLQRNKSVKSHIRSYASSGSQTRSNGSYFTQADSSFQPFSTRTSFFSGEKAKLFTSKSAKRGSKMSDYQPESLHSIAEPKDKVLPLTDSRIKVANLAPSINKSDMTRQSEIHQSIGDINDNRESRSITSLDKLSRSVSPVTNKSPQSIRSSHRINSTRRSINKRRTMRKTTIMLHGCSQDHNTIKPSLFDDMLTQGNHLDVPEVNIKQSDLEKDEEVRKVIIFEKSTHQEFSQNIDRLSRRFQRLLEDDLKHYEQRKEETDYLKVNQLKLSDFEIEYLKGEYKKNQTSPDQVDWGQLDAITSKLKFFAKLPEEIRLTLLREAEYKYYPRGSYVFKAGDFGDMMYVILRGSCNVRIMRKNIYGVNEDAIINCLYDGDKFGELSMMGINTKGKPFLKTKKHSLQDKDKKEANDQIKEKMDDNPELAEVKEEDESDGLEAKIPDVEDDDEKKYFERSRRSASIQTAESSDLLCIPRDKFRAIILQLIQKELDIKLKILLSIPFFGKLEPFMLIPLANNLTTRVFKMGEIIYKEGGTPEEFCIISQGRVRVVKEVTLTRMLRPASYSKARMPALKSFVFSGNSKRKEDDERIISANTQPLPPLEKELNLVENRTFHLQRIKDDESQNRMHFKNHVSFATLSKGEFFGGRALLGEEIANDSFEFQEFLKKVPKSKLAVVADSSWVEIFTINKKELLFIPNNIKKILINGLNSSKEFDDYPIQQECQNTKDWNKLKEREMLDYLKDKYFRKPFHEDYKKF